ncbi:bifunctional phosphopantothenoylcysteine decarboxylase/phosphopantothenate--cysteine ligase CoaBC [Thiomicrospira sp.]|uniref:bifunctional phosphopantothenoylcysteine decarboxylase/phosphopantothenate--cysteine ligase CoaBC n=1 Tax=Thiomicrospira sp. TaxID=935 RepID=UPI002F93A154
MKVLVGVSGGIAAYKALELVRLCVKAGYQVQVVMTEGAKQFIQPLSFQALCGYKVRDSLFDLEQEAGMGHIELARWADLIVIAPASADVLARLRVGMANDLLTTLCLATDRPILFAPAMNRLMWANAATQDNVAALQTRGWQMIEPASGEQACGEVGAGRLAEPETIFSVIRQQAEKLSVAELSTDKAPGLVDQHQAWWSDKTLLLTAGPTYEDLDPVRFIGNRSSGKMGFAIAQAAAELGAKVILISGPVNLPTPPGVTRINVRSALQMFEAVKQHYAQADIMIGAAAVADFRLAEPAIHKIKKQTDQDGLELKLVKNPDIIAWVAAQSDKPYVVGFAAETQHLIDYAKAKLQRKGLDMICANQVGEGRGFDTDENTLTLITQDQEWPLPPSAKSQQAKHLLSFTQQMFDDHLKSS